MISGYFHEGSGLGNQLFRYITTRSIARDKGFEFGMINPQNFKGSSFMRIDTGKEVTETLKVFNEKKVVENGIDIRGYDPDINFIEDGIAIDGEFQDERYWKHNEHFIRQWLYFDMLEMTDDVCVIGFRGGEYAIFPDLFLPEEYWKSAIEMMKREKPDMKFEVHTDDPDTARKFFPEYLIIHDIGINWRSVMYAKYLIIANSSFYILPAILNMDVRKVIAPRYWARHNTKVWALPQNFYKKFTYI